MIWKDRSKLQLDARAALLHLSKPKTAFSFIGFLAYVAFFSGYWSYFLLILLIPCIWSMACGSCCFSAGDRKQGKDCALCGLYQPISREGTKKGLWISAGRPHATISLIHLLHSLTHCNQFYLPNACCKWNPKHSPKSWGINNWFYGLVPVSVLLNNLQRKLGLSFQFQLPD